MKFVLPKNGLFFTHSHAQCREYCFHHVKFYFWFSQFIGVPVWDQFCCGCQYKEASTSFSGNMLYTLQSLYFGAGLNCWGCLHCLCHLFWGCLHFRGSLHFLGHFRFWGRVYFCGCLYFWSPLIFRIVFTFGVVFILEVIFIFGLSPFWRSSSSFVLFSITITGAPKLSAGIGLGNGVEFCQGSIGAIRSSLAMFTTSEHTQYTYKHPQYKAFMPNGVFSLFYCPPVRLFGQFPGLLPAVTRGSFCSVFKNYFTSYYITSI